MSSEDPAKTQYQKTRQDYLDGERRARQKVDEYAVAGAAGALALSVTFMDKIAPHPSDASKPYLLGSWITFLTALAVALVSLELSSHGYTLARDELDASHKEHRQFDHAVLASINNRIRFANRATLLLLFVATCLMVIFAFLNVNTRATASIGVTNEHSTAGSTR